MKTKDAVAKLRLFVARLVADGVPAQKGWHDWRKETGNEEFMAECFGYVREEGMPSITNLVRPFFHPTLPLIGLNYTQVAHNTLHLHREGWTPVLRLCRGIVFDRRAALVAFPFPKFFNYGEMHGMRLPEGPFVATLKEDGHLLIIFWYKGQLIGTTRGSFVSRTAVTANELLKGFEADWRDKFPSTVTLLAEFIHPDTHVIVDYGDLVEFRVNGVYNNRSYLDYEYPKMAAFAAELGLPVVAKWEGNSFADLMAYVKDTEYRNIEGFVARWPNGERLKFKCAGYIGKMIGGKLDHAYVMNQIVAGSFDKKMSDLPGEVQMAAAEIRDELLRVTAVEGDKKARCNFLYEFFPEEERTDYRKGICRKFYKWLVDSGQLTEPAPVPKVSTARTAARSAKPANSRKTKTAA